MDFMTKQVLNSHLFLDHRHESEVELRSRGYDRDVLINLYNRHALNKSKDALFWIKHRH